MSKTSGCINLHKAKNGNQKLNAIAEICRGHNLHIWQWKGHNKDVSGHSQGSYHYKTFPHSKNGRAFDTYGSYNNMVQCAKFLRTSHTIVGPLGLPLFTIKPSDYLTEGIFNGQKNGANLSVKYGHNKGKDIWTTKTWNAHANHIHIAI